MQTNVRLIDATALIERLEKMKIPVTGLGFTLASQHNQSIRDAIYAVNSLPTVETTDDVMARLPDWSIIQKRPDHYVATEDGREYINAFSPIEAVTRLEATLRA